ncbi:hypothetical protein DFH07DRAFT_765195 [Mycena maculata]|uniref:Uncharacterized protein n=1 Tax=Mycena maculata TaxID=230809 RepID=A0AAD7K8N8_9AGAR|nr:hypothetical protein DFH07DRAFT_765195 [Mycena maculata]
MKPVRALTNTEILDANARVTSWVYNDKHCQARNVKTRERMARLRAAEALLSAEEREDRRQKRLQAGRRYQEANRAQIADAEKKRRKQAAKDPAHQESILQTKIVSPAKGHVLVLIQQRPGALNTFPVCPWCREVEGQPRLAQSVRVEEVKDPCGSVVHANKRSDLSGETSGPNLRVPHRSCLSLYHHDGNAYREAHVAAANSLPLQRSRPVRLQGLLPWTQVWHMHTPPARAVAVSSDRVPTENSGHGLRMRLGHGGACCVSARPEVVKVVDVGGMTLAIILINWQKWGNTADTWMTEAVAVGDAYDLHHDARGYLVEVATVVEPKPTGSLSEKGLSSRLAVTGPVRTEHAEREAIYSDLYSYASREEARKAKARLLELLSGLRERREQPLDHDDLWIGEARPPIIETDHTNAGIAIAMFSWKCPECTAVMYRAPVRHYGEEAAISVDFENWGDESRMTYDWTGRKGGWRAPVVSGALHTHQPHCSSIIETSVDGCRAVERTSNIDVNSSAVPAYHQDDSQINAAIEADNFSYGLGDDTLPAEFQGPSSDGIDLQGKKKKRI